MADTVRELAVKITVDADTKPIDELGDKSQKAETKAVALGTVLGNLATKLVDVAIAAAKAAVAIGVDLVFGTAAAADEIAKMSGKLGVDVEELQRLRGAAELSGASVEDMASAVLALTAGLADAKVNGTGPVVEGFKAIGLTVEDVEQLLVEGKIEETMGVIGDAFNAAGDGAAKNAALLKIFGGAGSELRPLLLSGSEGITEMGDMISATGEVISAEALPKFEAMNDQVRLLEGRIDGLKNQIGLALAPAVGEIADRISAWVDANSEFINQQLPAILDAVADSLRIVADLVERVVEALIPAVTAVGELAGETLGKLIPALERLAVALGPVLEFVGERLAFALESLSPIVRGAADQLVFLADTLSTVLETGNAVLDWVGDLTDSMREDWPRAFAIAEKAITAITSPIETVRDVARSIVEWLEQAVPQIGEVAKIINRIRATLGLGEEGQSVESEGAIVDQQFGAFVAPVIRTTGRRVGGPAEEVAATERRRGGGGGGGGGARAAAEPTIEDLVANAVGGAAPQALRSATSALTGTLLTTTVINNNVDIGGIVVGAAIPADIAPEIVTAVTEQVIPALARQTRVAYESLAARNNVGP